MLDTKYLLQAVVVICYLAISTQADHPALITRSPASLDLKIGNVTSKYHIGLIFFTYDNDDFKISRDENPNSVKFNITKAKLLVLQGKTRSPPRPKYNIGSKGVAFLVDGNGTAQLSPDGTYIKYCKFILVENRDSKDNQVEEVVKEVLFKVLPIHLSQELCKNINEYHFNKINYLD